MHPLVRKAFPYFALLLGVSAVAYAMSFGTLPKADFAFQNGDQIKTLDPHRATGVPEHRVLSGLFEGLMREMPSGEPGPDGLVAMEPAPGVAKSYEVSANGTQYIFHLRENARWSDGSPVTAHDFVWSWRRALHPDTTSQYAYQLHYIVGAREFNQEVLEVGNHVEVELTNRPNPEQAFPSGTLLRGVLLHTEKPPEPKIPDDVSDEKRESLLAAWKALWIHVVEVKGADESPIDWDLPGEVRAFSQQSQQKIVAWQNKQIQVERSHYQLPDFITTVGVEAIDTTTLRVELSHSTPYFGSLAAFYTLYPVNRKCVETYGFPDWTKAENFVGNGPYALEFRRIRDRIRLKKSETYWNAEQVSIERIDAMAVSSATTALNMYLNGQLDWATDVPRTIISELKEREDFVSGPQLTVYFYRLNVARKPVDDPRVRRALNLAINKKRLVEFVTKAGEIPAQSLVPPGLSGYQPANGGEYNLELARQLLAEAGYPEGRGMPKVEVLYNTSDNHRMIAEVIERDWRKLGVEVELRNLEWGNYLAAQHQSNYTIARAGWVADYSDPNTFLDMWVTGGGQNETNWSNPQYDQLIAQASAESEPAKRMALLHEAEVLLMEEMPIIPIYYYVSINLVKPYVKNFHANVLDQHPLQLLKLEPH